MKDKILMYKFDVMHVPGAKNKGPDATSRYSGTRLIGRDKFEEMEKAYSIMAVRRWETSEFRVIPWEKVNEKAVTDGVYVMLNARI